MLNGKAMRILFIFSRHTKDNNDSTLTKDLANSFHKLGHEIVVVTMNERRNNEATILRTEHAYPVLRVRTGNYFNINRFEKTLTILTLPYRLRSAILKYFSDTQFDLIITHTPFMANNKIIDSLKRYFNCPAFLLLWDLFPQNAIDLGIIKNKLLIKYFFYRERKMLESFDDIFCMSLGNVAYLKSHYSYINPNQIHLQYNYAQIKPKPAINKLELRIKYGYSMADFIVLFGGNMGLPQKLENLIALADVAQIDSRYKFLLIGDGTELVRIKQLAFKVKLNNIRFINQMPREEYKYISSMCDIGMVSLDERFTVPNFPSKTIDYFMLGLPILASLDKISITDYGYFLTDIARAGLCSQAGDIFSLYSNLQRLANDKELYSSLSNNGRKFYETYLDSDKAVINIMNKYNKAKT